jgi:hypothetical protein
MIPGSFPSCQNALGVYTWDLRWPSAYMAPRKSGYSAENLPVILSGPDLSATSLSVRNLLVILLTTGLSATKSVSSAFRKYKLLFRIYLLSLQLCLLYKIARMRTLRDRSIF